MTDLDKLADRLILEETARYLVDQVCGTMSLEGQVLSAEVREDMIRRTIKDLEKRSDLDRNGTELS